MTKVLTIHTFHSTTMFKSTSLHLCINLTVSSNDCFVALCDAWVWDCTCVLLNSEDKLWKKKSAQGLAELIICKKKKECSQKRPQADNSNRAHHCSISVPLSCFASSLCKPTGCHTSCPAGDQPYLMSCLR